MVSRGVIGSVIDKYLFQATLGFQDLAYDRYLHKYRDTHRWALDEHRPARTCIRTQVPV